MCTLITGVGQATMKYVAKSLILALLVGSAHRAYGQVTVGAPPEGSVVVEPGATPAVNTAVAIDTGAAPPVDTPPAIAEVVVTAQRRSENLQKVPISVTAITGAQLARANVSTTLDLAEVTPSLTLSNSVGNIEPRIRGIGNSSAGPSVENSVATYVDGVYIASAAGTLQSLTNVQRVEVLDGPQGTLFGRNATGGLIQIITKDPVSSLSGNADVSYEAYDTTRVDFYATGGVARNIDADIAFYGSHQGDGFGTDLANDKPTYKTDVDLEARSKWIIKPTSLTTLRLSFDFSDLASSDPSLSPVEPFQPTYGHLSTGVQSSLASNLYNTYGNDPFFTRLQSGGLSGRVDQIAGPITFTDILAYRRSRLGGVLDADGTPAQIIEQGSNQDTKEFTDELQIAPTHVGKLQWIAGLYYFHLDADYDYLYTLIGAPPAQSETLSAPSFTTTSVAGYGQATYEVLPDTHITGGFRYTNEFRTEQGNAGAISAKGAVSSHLIPAADLTSNTPTWRLALDHQFTPSVLGYISWNRGFKSGGFNPTVVTQAPYRPEHLDDYEIGEKSTLFDGRLRFDVAGFFYNYKDIQVNTFVNDQAVIYNGAKAIDYGIDATFDASLTQNLTLSGGLVALHDRFTDFPEAVTAFVNPNETLSTREGPATGNRLPFAPTVTANLGFDYKHDIPSGRLDLFVNDLYNSGYYTQPDNFLHQGAFHQLNASLVYQPEGRPFTLKLYSRNLVDSRVADLLIVSSTGAAATYAPPTTYGFTVGLKF